MTIARILLVEDDPVSQELIAALLESRGHTVDACSDGFGALRLAQEQPYDLAFVDYHLPEMDGYALARLMRTLSDNSDARLRMVAITADRFGLAARREVDTIFDRVLTKPIEPDALFAFVDEILDERSHLDELEAFLAETKAEEATASVGERLWRGRGLNRLPLAVAFPPPTSAERAHLEHCFQLVEGDAAECIILLRQAGLGGVELLRANGKTFLQPLIVLDPELAPLADVSFHVGDGESWAATAATLSTFAARSATVDPRVKASGDFETRLAAYLYVASRSLTLCRDPDGRTNVAYTAGFAVPPMIEAIKRLAARGFVSAQLDHSAEGDERRLIVALTANGREFVQGPEMIRERA
jgi:CheY-like chemotaxis protein